VKQSKLNSSDAQPSINVADPGKSSGANDPAALPAGAGDGLSRRLVVLLVLVMMVLGAGLRFAALGRSALWIDEITVVGFAGPERFPSEIIGEIYRSGFKGTTGQHMPMQYVLINIFLHLYSALGIEVTPLQTRLPFALLGVLTLPLVYLAARRFFNRPAGLWAMALTAISFFHVYQSRDATSYGPLLFFVALNLYGVSGLMLPGGSQARRWVDGACVVLGSVGALFTHLTAWFFLGAEGLLLVLGVLAIALKPGRTRPTNYFEPAKHLLWPIGLIAVSCAPFLSFIVAAARNFSEGQSQGPVDTFSLELLFYQLAHFGLGRSGGRLIVFVVFLLAGLVWGLKDRRWRGATVFHAGLCVIVSVAFFRVLGRDFFPRYLGVVFLPLTMLAGWGLSALLYEASARLSVFRRHPWVAPLVVAVGLMSWNVGPFRVMFSMRDKLMPMSQVRDWLVSRLPDGALYVWRNGYHMREVPGALPVLGRQPAFADYPNAGIPQQVMQWRSQNGRQFFLRFPLAVLIEDADYRDPLWGWMFTDFAHNELIGNDSIARLWQWGFSPHGLHHSAGLRFRVSFNEPKDIVERAKASGAPAVWPEGAGWQYVQTREGNLFAAIRGQADLRVVNSSSGAGTYFLEILAAAAAPGTVTVVAQDGKRTRDLGMWAFEAGQQMTHRMGPFVLEPGESRITITQSPADRMALLGHAFVLTPAGSEAAPTP